jgi:dCTP deaminase
MVVLSDRELDALTPDVVTPFHEAALQPASVDLTLGEELLLMEPGIVDPEHPDDVRFTSVATFGGRWLVEPLRLCLGTTAETIAIPPDHVGMLHGRSSLGRLGLVVHCTAGLLDPGYRGRPTLEIVSLSNPIRLRPGMPIAQVTLHRLSSPARRPYGSAGLASRYQGDMSPTPARRPL